MLSKTHTPSPNILPVGSWPLSNTFSEKVCPVGSGVRFLDFVCVCGGVSWDVRRGSNNWLQTGSLCGRCLLNKQAA